MTRNIALLVLDSVRKDHFEKYAPRLQALADVSFERCYAASSWSAPSHASMLTGELPHVHGVHAHQIDFSILDREETFLGAFPNHRSIGMSTNVFAGSSFGFDELFDDFPAVSRNGVLPGGLSIEAFHRGDKKGLKRYSAFLAEAYRQGEFVTSLTNGIAVKLNNFVSSLSLPRLWDHGASAIVRGANHWVTDNEEPFFFFANFMEAHPPYEPSRVFDRSLYSVPAGWSDEPGGWVVNNAESPERYDEYLAERRELYAAAIDYLDRRLAPFINKLVERTNRETTVVITADHGEQLAFPEEDYVWGHVGSLSNALLHVPLCVVNPPERYEASVTNPVSHLDLGRLIEGIVWDDLRDVTRKRVPAERIGLGLSEQPDDYEYWDRAIRCVYGEDRRYEWDSLGEKTLYRVDGSSRERVIDDGNEVPDWTAGFFKTDIQEYKQRVLDEKINRGIDEGTQGQLEELGYL